MGREVIEESRGDGGASASEEAEAGQAEECEREEAADCAELKKVELGDLVVEAPAAPCRWRAPAVGPAGVEV